MVICTKLHKFLPVPLLLFFPHLHDSGYSQASYLDFITEAQASASRGMFCNLFLEIKGLNSPTPQNLKEWELKVDFGVHVGWLSPSKDYNMYYSISKNLLNMDMLCVPSILSISMKSWHNHDNEFSLYTWFPKLN